ncbi:MAG: hypothetical protein EOO29_39520, partial [Comamonadaceae bacterium]
PARPAGQRLRQPEHRMEVAGNWQLLTGDTSKQIGRTMGISPRTVEAHRARMMTKLGASNFADLLTRLAGIN